MSSLVTDNNNKKRKTYNTEEKNFTLGKLPEVLQKHTSKMLEHSQTLFKIKFEFETPQDQINAFYRKAQTMIQEKDDFTAKYRSDAHFRATTRAYYRNLRRALQNERTTLLNERLTKYKKEDNLVQCPMLKNFSISIIPEHDFIPRQDVRYNRLTEFIQRRLASADSLPPFSYRFGSQGVYSLIAPMTRRTYAKELDIKQRKVNEIPWNRFESVKNYLLELYWIHDDGPNRDSEIDYALNEQADEEIRQEFDDWVITYTDDANEAAKIVDELSDMNYLSISEPQQWDIVLRYNILQPWRSNVNKAIGNKTLQAVLHDLGDNDKYYDDNGGRIGMNTKNWKITKSYEFNQIVKDIIEKIRDIFSRNSILSGIVVEGEEENFGIPLTFENGNIGSERRPLTYTLTAKIKRNKMPLNKTMQETRVKFYKDNNKLKF